MSGWNKFRARELFRAVGATVPPETRARSFGNYILQNWGTLGRATRVAAPQTPPPVAAGSDAHLSCPCALRSALPSQDAASKGFSLSLLGRIQVLIRFRFFFGKIFFFKGIFVLLPKKYVEVLKQRRTSVDNILYKNFHDL